MTFSRSYMVYGLNQKVVYGMKINVAKAIYKHPVTDLLYYSYSTRVLFDYAELTLLISVTRLALIRSELQTTRRRFFPSARDPLKFASFFFFIRTFFLSWSGFCPSDLSLLPLSNGLCVLFPPGV